MSYVSPAPVDVAAATAAIPVGAVGSYALLGRNYGGLTTAGLLVVGSSLYTSSVWDGGTSSQSRAGTWEIQGSLGYYTFGAGNSGTDLRLYISVWKRVA